MKITHPQRAGAATQLLHSHTPAETTLDTILGQDVICGLTQLSGTISLVMVLSLQNPGREKARRQVSLLTH